MTTKLVIINSIEKETEKAILVEANGMVWLPKSQIEIIDTPIAKLVKMPVWLYVNNRIHFDITTTPQNVYETTGIIC